MTISAAFLNWVLEARCVRRRFEITPEAVKTIAVGPDTAARWNSFKPARGSCKTLPAPSVVDLRGAQRCGG